VFKDWSLLSNYEEHRLGRLWLVWRSNVRVTPLYKTSQLITCSILVEGRDEEFFVSFIYASNFAAERKLLWSDLRNHQDSPLFQKKAWLICGDFNKILEGDDHSLFATIPTIPQGMRDLQDLVRYCELTDLSYQGQRYTWCNKQKEGVICKKLDRVLVSKNRIQDYSQSYSVFESGGCSDHMRCRFHLSKEGMRVKRPFKFVNTTTEYTGFHIELEESWKRSPPLFHSTAAMFRLSKKLKGLKPQLRNMGKKMIGNISIRTKEAYKILCERQAATMSDPTEQAIIAEENTYEIWSRLSEIEERYLQQKAKLHWMKVGDQNNKTFYSAAKLKEVRNNIMEIQCEDKTVAANQESIKAEAERYFKEFLSIKPADYVQWSTEELENILQFKCDEQDKHMLITEVTEEEIKKVLFAMPSNK